MRLYPGFEARSIEGGDPVLSFFHVHDDDIVDDLAVFVQHGGVFCLAGRHFGEIADVDLLENIQRVCTGDLDQIVRPAVPAY